MEKRRQFLKKSLKLITGLVAFLYPFSSAVRLVYAKTKKTILPKNTTRQSLISKNPANLDTRNLEITPLKDFRTMGITDHSVNLNEWNLEVAGDVRTPLLITYSELCELPSVEKDVLLICPGIFVNNGRWKGISMKALLDKAGAGNGSTHVTFSGPKGEYEKSEQYPIGDVLSNKVFLAYTVNGKTLPQKHGFPLRLVAEDYYGSDWVKFVYKVTVETA